MKVEAPLEEGGGPRYRKTGWVAAAVAALALAHPGSAQVLAEPGFYAEPWVGVSWTNTDFGARGGADARLQGSAEVGLGLRLELDRAVDLYARGRVAPLTSVDVVEAECESDCEVKTRDGALYHLSGGISIDIRRRGYARVGLGYQGFAEETQEVDCQLGEPLCNGLRRFGVGPDAAGVELGLGLWFDVDGFPDIWVEAGDFITSGKEEAGAVQHLWSLRAGIEWGPF
jgi:hypothetical protein